MKPSPEANRFMSLIRICAADKKDGSVKISSLISGLTITRHQAYRYISELQEAGMVSGFENEDIYGSIQVIEK